MSSRFATRLPKAVPPLAALCLLLGLYGTPAQAASSDTEPYRVLVVTANLREAYGADDVSDHQDMAIFVDRLTAQVPLTSDVLLLQEVRHSSAQWVAQRLSDQTGSQFVVTVDPGAKPTHQEGRLTRFRETAILLNHDTMAGDGPGTYLPTRPKSSEVPEGAKPSITEHAVIGSVERSTGMALSFASVHFPPKNRLRDSVEKAVRMRWAQNVANYTDDRYPSTLRSVGGDFNSSRCITGGGDGCSLSPFWSGITENERYRDGVYSVAHNGGVDFVFTGAGTYQADVDSTYDPDKAWGDSTRFYSDHRFRWAVLGPDTVAPTAPAALETQDRRPDVSLDWRPSTDLGESGLLRYEVWRSGGNNNFRLTASLTPDQTSYVDRTTFHTKSYQYYIVACDGAHNKGARSSVAKISI